jgi:iron complex outermembrane receptor protein
VATGADGSPTPNGTPPGRFPMGSLGPVRAGPIGRTFWPGRVVCPRTATIPDEQRPIVTSYMQATPPGANRRGPPSHARATLLAALLAAPGLAAPTAAQSPDTLRQDTVYDLEPIAVRAVRPSATTGGVSAITVRLDSVRFRPAPLLEHVLRELPLVQIRRNSRGEATIALRGAEERQIAVLLDGVPLNLGWDHRTDLSVIPMTAAQSVRLIRGMSSVLHGPNVLGGAVEIDMGATPLSRVEPFRVAAGLDHEGGYSIEAASGRIVDFGDSRLAIRGGLGHRAQDGVPLPGDVDGVYPALAGGDLRANSDLRHTDGFFSARYARPGGAWVSATASGFQAERGVPVELNESDPRLWRYPDNDRLVTVVAGGLQDVANGLGTADLSLNVGVDIASARIESFALPGDPLGPSADADDFFTTVDETEASDDRTVTARIVGSQNLAAGAVVRAAATYADVRHDEVVTTGLGTGALSENPGSYRQRLWSLGAEAEIPFGLGLGPLDGGRVSLGLAYDGADTPEPGPDVDGTGPPMSDWGGRVGISATAGESLLLHTAVSRRGRFPALRESYSTALGRWHPNPDLQPEVLTAIEAGFTSRFGRYDVQVVGFHQRLDDAIVRGAAPAGASADRMRVNRDRIRSTGVEVLAGYTVGRLALETEFTLQDVEVTEADNPAARAEYEPEIMAGVGGSIPLPAGLAAGAELEYWGEQFCSTPQPGQDAYETLDPSTRADLQLSRTFRLPAGLASLQRLGVELAVDNVGDSAAYDQCGLPQPGRTFRLQVRLR